jgi:hypothetical protein
MMRKGQNSRGRALLGAAGRGATAGVAGAAVMTVAEKLEQALTKRPNSYVPARALLTLLGKRPGESHQPVAWNYTMHLGSGALLGALSGVWAAVGIRGPRAYIAHTATRLAFDQTVENATGVGAPPHTWPASEQVIDLLHKAVYSVSTSLIAERLVPPRLETHQGSESH